MMNARVCRTLRSGAAGRRGERGQGFLELAISLVFLLILFAAMVDLGYAFYTLIALRDTAQEAASYGAICPLESDNTTRNEDLIRERLRLSTTSPLDIDDIDPSDITVEFTQADGTVIPLGEKPVMGGSVIVTVTVQHKILTPIIGAFIGNQWEYPLTVTVSDTVLRNKWMSKCNF